MPEYCKFIHTYTWPNAQRTNRPHAIQASASISGRVRPVPAECSRSSRLLPIQALAALNSRPTASDSGRLRPTEFDCVPLKSIASRSSRVRQAQAAKLTASYASRLRPLDFECWQLQVSASRPGRMNTIQATCYQFTPQARTRTQKHTCEYIHHDQSNGWPTNYSDKASKPGPLAWTARRRLPTATAPILIRFFMLELALHRRPTA